MSTVHSLGIVGRIPVVIVEDDCVGGCQVDTETTSTRTQEEDEDVGAVGDNISETITNLTKGMD